MAVATSVAAASSTRSRSPARVSSVTPRRSVTTPLPTRTRTRTPTPATPSSIPATPFTPVTATPATPTGSRHHDTTIIGGIGPSSLWTPSQLTPRAVTSHGHTHTPNHSHGTRGNGSMSARSHHSSPMPNVTGGHYRAPSSLDGDIVRPLTASSVSSNDNQRLRYATPLPPDPSPLSSSTPLSSVMLPSSSNPHSSLATLTDLTNERMKRFQALYDRHHRHGNDQRHTDVLLSQQLAVWNERKNDDKKSFESTIGKITRITQQRGKTLSDDVYIRDEVQRRKHEFYKFVLPTHATSLKIEVEVMEGKLDMFVSNTEFYIFYSEAKSGKRDYQWQVNNVNAHRQIVIPHTDAAFKTGDYYISIYGHTYTTFTLKATVNAKGNPVRAGKTLAGNLQTRQNIRRRLDARVRTLLENKQAMQEFQSEIGKIKDDYRKSEESKMYSKPVHYRNHMVENLDVSQHRPDEVAARRDAQFERFERRLVVADEAAKRRLKEKQDRTNSDIEKREELRLANREAQRLAKEKAALQRVQRKWLYWINLVVRDQYWVNTLSDIKMMRFQRNRRERRAKIIQRFVRHALEQRRLHRAHAHLQSLRSVVLFFASNHQLIKKDRAANLIIAFLESVRGVNRLSRIVKNYRARILLVQRVHRNRTMIRRAKIQLWSKQWDQLAARRSLWDREYGTKVPERIKLMVLNDHYNVVSRLKRREIPNYEEQVAIWRKKQQIMDAKRKVFRDAIGVENPRPVRPHVPPCLDEKMLLLLMKDGVRKNKKAELLVASLDREDTNGNGNNDDNVASTIAMGSDALRAARRHRMAARTALFARSTTSTPSPSVSTVALRAPVASGAPAVTIASSSSSSSTATTAAASSSSSKGKKITATTIRVGNTATGVTAAKLSSSLAIAPHNRRV